MPIKNTFLADIQNENHTNRTQHTSTRTRSSNGQMYHCLKDQQILYSVNFHETVKSSRIYSVFEALNTYFDAVLADIYQAGLLTPRSHRSWLTVRCFPLVTQYTNVEHLLNTEIVGNINDKQSNTVRQFPGCPGVLDTL